LKLTVVDTPGFGDSLDCSNGYGKKSLVKPLLLNFIDNNSR